MHSNIISGCFIASFSLQVVMSFKVGLVPSPKTVVGTRTHWDEEKQSLFYCDVYGNESAILRYDYEENKVYGAAINGATETPFIIPIANTTDEYAVGTGRKVSIVQWDGVSLKADICSVAFEVDSDKSNNRFNAAKSDPKGRFFGGTMRSEKVGDIFQNPEGKVFSYVKGDGLHELLDKIFISNGMAWDENINKFYYIDSGRFDVKQYDYDPNTGAISNEKVLIDFSLNGGNPGFIPDGLTIDTDGNLYVTFFGGSKISKVDPRKGTVILDIPIPAKQVSACSFGGPNLDILYVTTASNGDDSEFAGKLFKVTGLNAKGFPGVKVHI